MDSAWGVVVFVVILVVGILAIVWASLAITFAVLRRRGERRLAEQLGDREIVRRGQANSFGVRSAGRWQTRGTGTLVLTPDELRFVSWGGARDVVIPLSAVTEVDTARSHLGKTMFRDLLRVTWRTDAGAAEVVAWAVSDVADWVAALGAKTP